MDENLIPEQKDDAIESFLRELALAPMPLDLTPAVMANIRTSAPVRYRLTRNDIILSVVISLSILALWIGLQSLPALVLLKLRIQGILLWQRLIVNADWLIPSVSFAVGIGLIFLILLNLRPMRRV